MAFLLLEITSRDAYERFYKSIPEDEYYTIIHAVQGKDNDEILLPETKWALGLRKKNSPRFMEDLQKLRGMFGDGYLDIFLRAKERRMISGTQADLNQYKSIAELGRFVSSLDVDAILGQTKGEQSNAIHEAKDDIEKLYEDDEWIILIPKTHEASCYWAKGAHWCTAYRDDDEWFNKYSSEGPLFMNINKKNPQLSTQFHIESQQYMDYYDNAIEEPIFEQISDGDILLDFYQNYLPAEKFMSMIGSELGNGLYAAYLYDYDYGEEGHDDEYAYFMVDVNMNRIAGPFEDMYQFNGHDVTRVIYNDSKYNLVDTKGKLQFDVPLLNINQVHNLKNKFVGKTCNASSMDDDGNITTKEKSHIVVYDNGQVIHFYQYNDFTCYGNFTLVKGEVNSNVLNSDFQPIFKKDYLNIRPFSLARKQYFAIQKMNKWNLSDISGNILWDNWVYDIAPNFTIHGLPIETLKVNTGIGLNLYDINGNPMVGEDVEKFTWSNWKSDGVVSGVMMLNGDYNFLDNKFNIIDRDGKILYKGLYEPMNENRKTLNENYHGEIYHFTSLIQGSWIVDDDALYANISQSDECEGVSDDRKYIDSDTPFISFTRDKNYSIQGNNRSLVCFVFDGDDIQKIRNARLYPFSFGGYAREECEERVYGVNIKPLHKYLKRIEIKLSNKPYSWSSDRQYDEEDDLYDEFKTKFPDLSQKEIDQLISNYLVDKITNNKLVGSKVIVKNNVNENRRLLSEIKVVDAYTKYYQDIPERDFQRIILNIQKDNDTLLPETKWVLKLYKTKTPRLMEDLYKLCNDRGDGYLDVFKRAKERRVISGTQADLNQYKSIAELGRFITSLDVDNILGKTKGEQSNSINAAKDDIEVPYEDEFWKVVIPKSYEASCYWGNGTQWCTATRESDEWYEHYSEQGPLYININKRNGQKFQFHFETDSYMDQYDSEMEMPFINEMGENTDGLIQFYIKLKGKEWKEVFTGYDRNGLKRVYVPNEGQFNLKKENDGELLFDRCYEDIGDYDENGFYPVQNEDDEWNLITIEGNYISDNWYDYISNFFNGLAVVGKRELPRGMSYNLMDLKGEILLDEWYANIGFFYHGFARIVKDGKVNVVNSKGEIVLPKWYAEIVSIDDDGVIVGDYIRDNYMYNKLDFNGNPIYEWVTSRYKVGEKPNTNFWENKSFTKEEIRFIKETAKKMLK